MKTLLFLGSFDQNVAWIHVPNAHNALDSANTAPSTLNALESANKSQLDQIQKELKIVQDQINAKFSEVIATQIAQQKQISLISSVQAESKATLDAILQHLQKDRPPGLQASEEFDPQLTLPLIFMVEISILDKKLKDEPVFKNKMVKKLFFI